jgi:hypothetical protein
VHGNSLVVEGRKCFDVVLLLQSADCRSGSNMAWGEYLGAAEAEDKKKFSTNAVRGSARGGSSR